MVSNPWKFQIMFLVSKVDKFTTINLIIENKHVNSEREIKLFGKTIDDKLSFVKHINKQLLKNIYQDKKIVN